MKNSIFIVCVFSLILCGTLAFCLLLCSCNKTNTVRLVENTSHSDHIVFPIKVNNKKVSFIFDTGASFSVIDLTLARKMRLKVEGLEDMTITRFADKEWRDTVAYTNSKVCIGNFHTDGMFYLNGYYGVFSDEVDMKKFGAVLGMNIIGQFNWLFHFADNTVTISKDSISIPTLTDDQVLTLNFYLCNEITCVDLIMDGITIKDVKFDTGYDRKSVQLSNKSPVVDIFFSKSDFETLNSINRQENTIHFSSQIGKIYIKDTMKINDFTIQGLLTLEHNDYTNTYITAHFIRRFRMMYFDSTNSKIQLYVSPSDSARHDRKNLQSINRKMLQLFENSEKENLESEVNSVLSDLW